MNIWDLSFSQSHFLKVGPFKDDIFFDHLFIAEALDYDNYVALASLDLSAAFDIVNVGLLLKRLKIIGLPPDVFALVEIYYLIELNSMVYISVIITRITNYNLFYSFT